ncbi:MAG TPA: DUF5683 domain-containing protein [Chitinophagaceae bacterium]|nr:DUF5683 domain-containing protein [Chitinophagaceae bacterium]
MLKISSFFTIFFFLFIFNDAIVFAQQKEDTTSGKKGVRVDMQKNNEDTLLIRGNNKADTSGKNLLALDTATRKKFNPKTATLRSAIIPGWGQAYNKKYWKIPIVYGALGTTAYIFLYNLKTYKLLRQAVVLRSDKDTSNDNQIDPRFRRLSLESIRTNRNLFRQNIDYSVLFFLVFWALNVVDATVDAHLKAFDVSPDITIKIRPGFNYMTSSAGISLVFNFKDKH